MTAYIIRRLLLVIPTLLGIMVINFAVVQIVPGGPVEQMIAQMSGNAVESTARFSGGGEGENINAINVSETTNFDSKYRGAQGLDPDIIKEIVEKYPSVKDIPLIASHTISPEIPVLFTKRYFFLGTSSSNYLAFSMNGQLDCCSADSASSSMNDYCLVSLKISLFE